MESKPTFNKFDEIEHMPLRVFNRTAMLFNLMDDFGNTVAEEYLNMFNEGQKQQILIMNLYIKKFGLDKARSEATKDLVLPEEEEEYIEIDGLTS